MTLRFCREAVISVGTVGALAFAALLGSTSASAASVSGITKGLSWTATSTIIGQGSTATIAGGGNPINLGLDPKYRSTVGLLIDEGAAGRFVCSGSLSADRKSIITAAHCVTNGHNQQPVSVTAYFYNPGSNPNASETPIYTVGAPNVTTVAVSNVRFNPLYTGEVIDDHDIAKLTLAAPAPAFALGYAFYNGTDLTGLDYNIAGFGVRSDVGGSLGNTPPHNLGTGRLRQGDNRYDFRFGDADFGGLFDGGPGTTGFFGTAETTNTVISDFDNGTNARDGSCGLAQAVGLAASPKYCNLGRGATEVSSAGGDSGGPQFVNGQLASVTSFGLTFGNQFQPGDLDNSLNDSFGEFNGFVPIYNNLDFLNSVPEPASWMMMIAGFGLVGAAVRRRRQGTVAA
jgi:hypothetical protein